MSTYTLEDLRKRWMRLLGHLRIEFGNTAFKSWIQCISVRNLNEGTLTLSVPTDFLQVWVSTQYLKHIEKLWKIEIATIQKVVIIHRPVASANDEVDTPVIHHRLARKPDPKFTFNSFVVNKTNELAFATAKRVANGDGIFNPLFFFGDVGLGKTHLMQAIVTDIQKNHAKKKVLYLSAEKFMYKFINALRNQDTIAFKEEFRNIDVLLMDDIQFIAGKVTTQEEFFHTFNDLIDKNCQIVLSADRPPAALNGVEDRIKSRMGWGIVAEIHKADYALRLGILQTKVHRLNANISKDILEFLATKITSNIRELEGALNRLIAYSSLEKRHVNMSMVPKILHDVLQANSKSITIEDIQKCVANHYNIKIVDMHSPRRNLAVARPRQMAIYLAKQFTQASLPEIGRKFGGRDHTTVLYAVQRIKNLLQKDEVLSSDIKRIKSRLNV